ncbi:MAG: PSD1 and planctomycete cytochrome C domain-containing protein [Aeoliella sp.]
MRNPSLRRRQLVFLVSLMGGVVFSCATSAESTTNYNRDIRPLLSDRCYKCHGPDRTSKEAQETTLRVDLRESVVDDYGAIEPGDVEASELVARITADDHDLRMPPTESGKTLSAEEIALLKQWIAEGAEYQPHWAFVAPVRSELPETKETSWPVSEIDRFTLAGMETKGLSPSPEADRITLLRRVTLDLTGLPPTRDEVRAFLADTTQDAYERAVDRLLASPRFGEHMARYWLDAARYGDTHGLHLDNYREMWPYRDAVVRAMNDNVPWDQFVVKSVAGDLLPEASLEDQVLSGFNRCHVSTNEGGSIAEEVYVRNVVDRVSTTGTVFLGLTMGCAVCHDHKFDPITTKDFYSSFAFFNNLDANPMDGNAAQHAPVVRVPTEEQLAQRDDYELKMKALSEQLDAPLPNIDAAQVTWEAEWSDRLAKTWNVLEPVEAKSTRGATLTTTDDLSILISGINEAKDVHEFVAHVQEQEVVAIRLEALADESFAGQSVGRSHNGNAVLSEIEVEVAPLGDANAEPKKVRFVSAVADHSQEGFPVANAIDGNMDPANGWGVEGHVRRENRTAVFVAADPFGFEEGTQIRVRLSYQTQYAKHVLGRVRLAVSTDAVYQPVTMSEWSLLGRFDLQDAQKAYHTDFGPESEFDLGQSYQDGKLAWTPKPEFTDGKVHPLPGGSGAWYLHRRIYSPNDRELTVSLGSDDAVRVWVNGLLAHENNVARGVAPDQDQAQLKLRAGQNDLLVKVIDFGGNCGFYFRDATEPFAGPDLSIAQILKTPAEHRTDEELQEIRVYYRRTQSPEWNKLADELAEVQQAKTAMEQSLPTTLVMKERAEPKPAYLLKRGEYSDPDKDLGPLSRAVPAFLPPLPEGAPVNRLGYAQWLIDPANPLLARVTVNRLWQQCFGIGIVETAGDFGAQGSWPSHPELLDWLAVEFRESGWDVKQMMKRIVMSSTYRQSSRTSADLVARDPHNRLHARGPRYRLDAEVLRDQALFVSGLLNPKLGGPGVKPPQPDGIWKAVAYSGSNTKTFVADMGSEKVHRRSLYTFWKRTAPAPQMTTLDGPSRESCIVRRERTNTPLQALLLLNDPQFVEAARKLAERAMQDTAGQGGNASASVAATMFELATLRVPEDDELAVLVGTFNTSRDRYQANPEAASKLLGIGEAPRSDKLAIADLAAWTLVANTVLNLDEVVTKE